VKNPQSARFSDQLKRNTMKTVYQGQPSNIIISRILSDSAVIEFTQIGSPVTTMFELSSGGIVSNTYSVEGGQSKFQVTGLLPGTTYEINLIITYKSGDQFPVNHKKTFVTLAKWKVSSVSYIYPRNKTIEVSQNFNYTAIDLSFDLSPGNPTQYIIQVGDDVIHAIKNYYVKPLLYPIYIRNDSTTIVKVITEYNDDQGYNDVSFAQIRTLSSFLEGASPGFDEKNSIMEGSNFISISFSKAPGNPEYHFFVRSSSMYKKYSTFEYSNGIMDISLSEFNRDTDYNLYIETYYSQSGNTYRNTNDISFTTMNHSPIQNVRCFATNRSLTFSFESPTGDFLNIENSYFSMTLRDELGNDVLSNAHVSKNTTEITYPDLSIHAEYTFQATAYYSDVLYYTYERTERTLYEEAVQNVAIYNIKGTTVDVLYTPFTLPNDVPSIPDYYVIQCIDPFGDRNSIQTYNTQATLTNLLNPDTTYAINIISVYSSGNSYEINSNPTSIIIIHTKNEGPVESIMADRIKGDRIDFSWKKYDRLLSPSTFKIEIYQNISPNEFVDFSFVRMETMDLTTYHSCQQDILSLSYDTEYEFVFISEFPNHIYSRSVYVKTLNEYYVKLFRVIADSTSIEFYKNNITNNQDKYFFVRTPNSNDVDLNIWAEQDVSSNTNVINPTYFAGQGTTFSNIEMSKNGLYVMFCPNQTEIQIYKQFEVDTVIESSITGDNLVTTQFYHSLLHTVYPGKPIISISVNYEGDMFIVGFNDNTVYLYDVSINCTQRPSIDVIGTTSRSVVMSPSGNIFAVSNGELRDSIFIMDVTTNTSYNYYNHLVGASDNWFKTILNKYVQFDYSGSIMTIGLESFYFPLDGTASSVTTQVKVLDRSVFSDETFLYTDRHIDVSGSRVSLNSAGTKLAVVDNYDISSNSIMYGSVIIYDISASNKTASMQKSHTFWGSENIQYPMYRNCSINDNGNVVAIGEYKYSYKPTNSIDGQVLVYELSGNSWSLKGFPIRQTDDVDPTKDSDTILTGEWLGYKLILDRAGDNLLTSTRPKLNLDLSVEQGKGFFYKWRTNDDIYKFAVSSWPVVIKNLMPLSAYQFRIYATYNVDPGYSYFEDVSLSTLSGQKPDVSYSIYNNRILLRWKSVTWDKTIYDTLKYTVRVTLGSTKIVDVSMIALSDIPGRYYDISYDIATELTINTAYNIIVSSDFTRKIYDALNNESIVQFIYRSEQIVRTLNERASDIRNIVALNSANLVVFDVENAGLITDISQNKITLNMRDGVSYSFVIIPPAMLDIRQFQLGDEIKYFVETTYKKQPDSGPFIFNNGTYSISGEFDVSNVYFPDTLLQNGRFDPETSYERILEFQQIKRYPVEISKGIYRIIPPKWSEQSHYIVTIENRPQTIPTISSQLFLNNVVTDISYHVVLYRSEDLAPGTQIQPANLTQTLQGSVFSIPYKMSFYIRNQDVSTAIYDKKTNVYFSEDIKYQIEFADVLNNDYIFYKTSPLRNTKKKWMKLQCHLNFPISRKKVKYAIRRLDKETNNLYISDISMIFTNKASEPYAFLDVSSWNCLSVTPTPWENIWTYDGSYQVIQLSCNMSISCWFYLHYTDVSQCIFLLGTDETNATPGIYIDNSHIIIKNVYADSSYNHTLTTPSVLGVATHFVVTYFNNTISTYLNGIACEVVDVSQNALREADINYKIYIGNPNEKTLGVVLKSVKLYDYPLDLSFISNALYNADNASYQIGNPNDILSNYKLDYLIATSSSTNDNERQVTLPVLANPTLYKNVYLNSTLPPFSSDISCVSMWIDASSSLFIDQSLCVCTSDTFTFRGHQIKLKNAVNHFVIANEAESLKLYMNGYLYLTDDTTPSLTSISGSNLGEVIVWNKILSESNILTSYYNYYNMYSSYDLSGYYKLFVKYPRGIQTSARTVFYQVSSNPYTELSGTMYLYENSDISYVIIQLDPFSLNTFHKKQDTIRVRLSDYNVVHDIFAGNAPYIQYNYSNIQYITEATTVDFWIENLPVTGSTFLYTISGGITGSDLSGVFDIGGIVGSYSSRKVSIVLKEDYTIEDMETLMFSVPSLNLSTLLYVYDRLFFSSNRSYANKGDVFTITLRSKITSFDTGYTYRILGVSGEDISGADLSGTIYFDSDSTYTNDVSLSFVDISFTVTANDSNRTNLPFKIILSDNDLSHVSISLWLNDFYNLTANNTIIKEGDEFSFTFKTPYTVNDDTSFAYMITGISSEDLYISDEYSGLSGYFVSRNATDSKKFKYKYNALPDQNKTMKFLVAKNGLLETDLSFSSRIIHVEPAFRLSGPLNIDEGQSFTITLEDLSLNLPNGTVVKYTLSSGTGQPVLSEDIRNNSNPDFFTLYDGSGTANFTAIADNISDGEKTIKFMLVDFPNISWSATVLDKSQAPSYDLSFDRVGPVQEGETFKLILGHLNVPDGTTVPFDISGTINIRDILGLTSLQDVFTVPHDISRSYFVQPDSTTEGLERVEFHLINNSAIKVAMDIIDSSPGPIYEVKIVSTNVDQGNLNSIVDQSFNIILSTTNVANGTDVSFSLSNLSDTDLIYNASTTPIRYYSDDSTYRGKFTVGFLTSIQLRSNVTVNKLSTLKLENGRLQFYYNNNNTEKTEENINFRTNSA
jgi:hypothetical protein